jgi:hypothetical protein
MAAPETRHAATFRQVRRSNRRADERSRFALRFAERIVGVI